MILSYAESVGQEVVTVACNDELTTADLFGRYELVGGDTRFVEGGMVDAASNGKLLYLDEIDKASPDLLGRLHPTADHRRALYVPELGGLLEVHPDFGLVASYNPSPGGFRRGLPPAIRQRFASLSLDYLPAAAEAVLLQQRAGVEAATAECLVAIAGVTRRVMGEIGQHGASTRALLHAAAVHPVALCLEDAVRTAIVAPITDDSRQREVIWVAIEAAGLAHRSGTPDEPSHAIDDRVRDDDFVPVRVGAMDLPPGEA